MDQDRAQAARQKIEHYRKMLAKGVDGGTGMIYPVEITRLKLLLEEIEAGKRETRR